MSALLCAVRAKVAGLARRLGRDERGQTLWEYVMIGILVLVAVVFVVRTLGSTIGTRIQDIIDALQP